MVDVLAEKLPQLESLKVVLGSEKQQQYPEMDVSFDPPGTAVFFVILFIRSNLTFFFILRTVRTPTLFPSK